MKELINKENVLDIFECNMVQKGMLFHYLSDLTGNIYNAQISLLIQGMDMQPDLLRQAFSIVQSGNEALRSVFRWDEVSRPVQIVLKDCPVDIAYYDYSSLSPERTERSVNDLIAADQLLRFDLTKLPVRITLIRTAESSSFLVLTHHHILYDGWSSAILLEELFSVYQQLVEGTRAHAETKPSFKTVLQQIKAARLHPALPGVDGQEGPEDKAARFWKDYLKDHVARGILPDDRNADVERNVADIKRMRFSASIQPLESFAAAARVTKASVVYTAFGLLLKKYFSLPDIVFGTTVSDRDPMVQGHDRVIGNFINTIPFRLTVPTSISSRDLVAAVNRDLLIRNEYSSTSYGDLKKLFRLKVTEDLFDCVMVIENYPIGKKLSGSLSSSTIKLNGVYENTGIPLVVTVFLGTELGIEFSYNANSLSEAFIEALGNNLIETVEKMVTDPSGQAESIPLVPSPKQVQQWLDLNDTKTDYPGEETILSLFDKQANLTPGAVALEADGKEVTYEELKDRSSRIASWLIRETGLKAGDLVAILLHRDELLVPVILGILRAGAAWVPVDPAYPVERVGRIMEDAGAKVLLTAGKDLSAVLPPDVIVLDPADHTLTGRKDMPVFPVQDARSLAYVIFTSGSTGKPKGVMIEHRSLVNYITWAAKTYSGNEKLVFPLYTSISFDLTITSIFTPLITGGTICQYREDEKGFVISQVINDPRINIVKLTPSHLKLIRDMDSSERSVREKPLRFIVGGEDLSSELARDIVRAFKGNAIIYNEYGPTEATVGCMCYRFDPLDRSYSVSLGKPAANMQIHLLDASMQPVLPLQTGEIYIAGDGLARGYINNKVITDERFFQHPRVSGQRLYKTGDLAVFNGEGQLFYKGRIDAQVKIRGFRIEPEEIEAVMMTHDQIKGAAVLVQDSGERKQLIAYYISDERLQPDAIKAFLAKRLPSYMVPSAFRQMEVFPVNMNGKLERKALLEAGDVPRGINGEAGVPQGFKDPSKDVPGTPSNSLEVRLSTIWSELLGLEKIDIHRNFFDAGGDSLLLMSLRIKINKAFGLSLTIPDLFQYATIGGQAAFIGAKSAVEKKEYAKESVRSGSGPQDSAGQSHSGSGNSGSVNSGDIAIIGMAGRFPGAVNISEFWQNLRSAKDCITRKDSLTKQVVHAKGFLEDPDMFDAGFFEYIPSEALSMDPQIRLFHECSWEALEHAGYDPLQYKGRIGLYGGASPNPLYNLNIGEFDDDDFFDKWSALTYADKDFLCSRVSYKLNLKGPSISLATACSTSLVAVDMACGELLAGKCEMALAGGISVTLHDNEGYIYHKGMILSPDGKCRAFDESAAGTVGGNGVGIVVLKRLQDAIRDEDNILAVIKGSATNNDGEEKVGFSAPGINGQAGVISEAIRKAGIPAETITYVEAHGTGTALGDPVEVAGLSKAFGSEKKQFCAIGSVKSNIGHLDVAAGIAGLIKVVLSLQHGELPASLHVEKPNPDIDFSNSPFYVNQTLRKWERGDSPRRAGVSSFGIGGTNAHVILEEAPVFVRKTVSDKPDVQLITLSGKSPSSLVGNIARLADYLRAPDSPSWPDIAHATRVNKTGFRYRKTFVSSGIGQAAGLLQEELDAMKDGHNQYEPVSARRPAVVFMFSGQGAQYVQMYRDLYMDIPYFKQVADECFELYRRLTGNDLFVVVFPQSNDIDKIGSPGPLDETIHTQPALFIMEYALAKLLMHWGISPDLMIGHSIGEYVAACISGVFSMEDALKLVTRRGILMQGTEKGAMLSIAAHQTELLPLLSEGYPDISIAAVNGPVQCIVSGPVRAIGSLGQALTERGISHKGVRTSHAFHSSLMDPILDEFFSAASGISYGAQQIPFLSNFTGTYALDEDVTSPRYWTQHLRHEVRFEDGVSRILEKENAILLELGPGNSLANLVRSHAALGEGHTVLNLVRHPKQLTGDHHWLLKGIGELWEKGISVDWKAAEEGRKHQRVVLPSYAFDRQSFPITNRSAKDRYAGNGKGRYADSGRDRRTGSGRIADPLQWFYAPVWKSALPVAGTIGAGDKTAGVADAIHERIDGTVQPGFLLITDDHPLCQAWAKRIQSLGGHCTVIVINDSLEGANGQGDDDHKLLFRQLKSDGIEYEYVIYALVNGGKPHLADYESCYDLVKIVRAAYQEGFLARKQLVVLTGGAFRVLGDEPFPLRYSGTPALLNVIRQEYPSVEIAHIDVDLSARVNEPLLDKLTHEVMHRENGKTVALRFGKRWLPSFEQIAPGTKIAPGTMIAPETMVSAKPISGSNNSLIRERGVYLLSGGLGELGYALSSLLIRKYQARLILIGQTPLPPRKDWEDHLTHPGSDEKVKTRIGRYLDLEQMGGDLRYAACDISDEKAVSNAVRQAEQEWGPVNGIIHAAGITATGAGRTIDQLTRKDFEQQYSAKAGGFRVLNQLASAGSPDFCLAISSISTLLGGLGMGAYAPANMLLDHLVNAEKTQSNGQPWISVDLDGLNLSGGKGEGIVPAELDLVFERLLTLTGLSQVVVSVGDLDRRIDKWVRGIEVNSGVDDRYADKVGGLPAKENTSNWAGNDQPVTITEKLLRVWRTFFGMPGIGLEDNFFAIGGDSLKALIVISKINNVFHTDLAVSEVFGHPTIKEFAKIVETALREAGGSPGRIDGSSSIDNDSPSIDNGSLGKDNDSLGKGNSIPAEKDYPLSSVQKRIYFLQEFDKLTLAYNMPLVLQLEGNIDIDRIRASFSALIQRHESLRTFFPLVEGGPVQRIAVDPSWDITLYTEEAAGIGAFVRPFDLANAPLFRVGLIRQTAHSAILMVDIHHIISDGISRAQLISDFMTLYKGGLLPPVHLQYKDFVYWQQDQQQQMVLGKQMEFWRNVFADGVPSLNLPLDKGRPPVKSYAGEKYDFELDPSITSGLNEIARQEGMTMFMVLLSLYNVLLSKLCDQEDIVIGIPVSGRLQLDHQQIIGMFVNTLPMRHFPRRDRTFRDFLGDVRSRTLQYFDHQACQYEDLVDQLHLQRDTSHNPIFDVLFSYENFEVPELILPGLTMRQREPEQVFAKFDLTLTINEREGYCRCSFEFCSDLFNTDTVGRFARYFQQLAAVAIQDQDLLLKEIGMIPEMEKELLLSGFNNTQADLREDDTIVTLFDRWAQRVPHQVALVFGEEQLTYRQLQELSERMAASLRSEYGIGINQLVAIMVGRSANMVAALLAILKAGAAYVPIDPVYPTQRAGFMLADSGVQLLITDRRQQVPPDYTGRVVFLEELVAEVMMTRRLSPGKITPESLCYLIYTSGSTGTPKGVMITHGAVVNFFHGMSREIPATTRDRMLAVTSIAFDISVLELFWTLCSGIEVVVHPSDVSLNGLDRYVDAEDLGLDYSLFFFSSYTNSGEDKYGLLLDAARFADREGFTAVWTPERHFHEFGGLFPNPSVLSSALAMITDRIQLRSGSVVLPLHDEIRIVEEWSVVDNLSGGRVALSFAPGWNPNDFVLSEGNFPGRQQSMYEKIKLVKTLWQGDSIRRENGFGQEWDLRVFPEPVQKELPVWITSGGSEDTFRSAGAIGANVLTHLLGQDMEGLAVRIALYRKSRAEHGFDPAAGKVTIMLHTYIGDDIEEVEQIVEQPFIEYLKSSLGLAKVVFEEEGKDEADLTEEAKARVLKSAFKRYYKTSSLIGTKHSCGEMLRKLKKIGVDEIACLVDFGIDQAKVMQGLNNLKDLKNRYSGMFKNNHRPITMMQSTPSYIGLLEKDAGSAAFLDSLRLLLIGGEAMPGSLLRQLRTITGAALFNMYGPTETTIWSCVHPFNRQEDRVSIGKPIINTQIYILDKDLKLLPVGVTGDLYIGGSGLSKGYWKKPELTTERFVSNPFKPGMLIYKTGDIARWLPDGSLEFAGRSDHQVKIRGYRIEPGEIELALLKYPLIREAVVVVRETPEGKILVAYVISDTPLDSGDLRTHLSDSLPPYMIPGSFMVLDKMPLTANGKIDRKALPDPGAASFRDDYESPKTEAEKLLTEVWSKVLGAPSIGITDNFFAIGGDSIKSIQIISRMRSAGYDISAKDIFISQTIKQLAPKLKKLTVMADQSIITGQGELTPIQRWYFDGVTVDPHHYNQSVMLHFTQGIGTDVVSRIFEKILEHHDALRMVFHNLPDRIVSDTHGKDVPVSIVEEDLRGTKEPHAALLYQADLVQAGIDLQRGPLLKLGLFHLDDGSRLLIVIHHLVVDGISWRILFEDIDTLYRQIMENRALSLPLKTDPFQSWAKHLAVYTKTRTGRRAMTYWQSFPTGPVDRLQPDYSNGVNTGEFSRMHAFKLDSKTTDRFLKDVHAPFGTQANDILLSALYLAMQQCYGHRRFLVDLEGHGREDIGQHVNISRTIGWFTSIYKVLLAPTQSDMAGIIKQIKETSRSIPNNGLDYLLYRYESSDSCQLIDGVESGNTAAVFKGSQVSFNYLGQFDTDTNGHSFSIAKEADGERISPKASWAYDWDIVGLISGGELTIRTRYSTDRYEPETIASFMKVYQECLHSVIDFCCSYGRIELTPSDMTYKGLSIAALSKLQTSYDIQDVYPLSYTQEGILYHSLMDKEAGSFNIQTTCLINGVLDVSAVEKSMNQLMARYDILRTLFLHEGYDRHIQVVLKERKIDLRYEDIRETCLHGDKTEIIRGRQLLEREKHFNLSKDVLMRLLVLRTADKEYELIWNHHHILMDGWCVSILVDEFMTIYSSLVRGETTAKLALVKPYASYIEWLGDLENEDSTTWWKQYLASYENPVGLPKRPEGWIAGGGQQQHGPGDGNGTITGQEGAGLYEQRTHQVVIGQSEMEGLRRISRQFGVTLNTIMQGIWGLLLAKYNNVNDVVFGSVVSGRPAAIEGVERMVGLFINTIPVRVQYHGEERIGDFLQRLQAVSLESEAHHYHPLSEIQTLSQHGGALLDHTMAFENFPVAEQIREAGHGTDRSELPFEISQAGFYVQTNNDFDITISPQQDLLIRMDYNIYKYDEAMILQVGRHLANLVRAVAAGPLSLLKDISLYDELEGQSLRQWLTADLAAGQEAGTIQEKLRRSFSRFHDHCAIEYRGSQFSYEQVGVYAAKVAAALSVHGIEAGSYIGVLCEDRRWLISSVLGIVQSAGAFVPLETSLPAGRLSSMIHQAAVRYIITDQDSDVREKMAPDGEVTWITIDSLHEYAAIPKTTSYDPEAPLYIFFTSGSTGIPKGVVGKNKSLAHFVEWEIAEFGIEDTFRFSQFVHPGFDAFMRDVFVPLCSGGTICIPDAEDLSTAPGIRNWIHSQRISLIHCVPSFFKLFGRSPLQADLYPALRYVLMAGEKILPFELRDWFDAFGDRIRLINLYGATETTLVKAFFPIRRTISGNFIPVKAMPGAQLLVLDKDMQVCPPGSLGEIFIRTPYRSAGYLDSGATARSFIPNPYNIQVGEDLLYRTGDLGRILLNGHSDRGIDWNDLAIEIAGRSDQQVKIRGIRIEPDDIRENILKYPGVADALVMVKEEEDGEKFLCAYIVPAGGDVTSKFDADKLREFLLARIPANMIPSFLVLLERFPLLPNGKLDRKALPEPGVEPSSDHCAPANETEDRLADIWSEVLKMDKAQISTSRSFIELGGHSLKLLLLINKINQQFNISVPLKVIFDKKNIQNLADYLITVRLSEFEPADSLETKEITI